MKTKVLITLLLLTSSSLFYILDVNADISGCYVVKENLPELTTNQKLTAISWMKIEHKNNNIYSVRGELTGANHHICTVAGEKGVIEMKLKNNTLNYQSEVEYYDGKRLCDLNFNFSKTKFIITDNNYNCSKIIFACGERIQLHEYEFPLKSKVNDSQCKTLIK